MKNKALLLFFGFISLVTIAQQKTHFKDSLKGKSSEKKVIYLLQKAKEIKNNDSSLVILKQAYKISKKLTKDSLKSASLYKIANKYYWLEDFNESEKILNLLNTFNKQPYYTFRSENLQANIFFRRGKYKESLRGYKTALKAAIKYGDSLAIGDAYHNVAGAYFQVNLKKEAISFYKKALNIYNVINAPETEKRLTYLHISRAVNSFKEGESYLKKALHATKLLNSREEIAWFYLIKADAYRDKGIKLKNNSFFNEGIKSLNKSLYIGDSLQSKEIINLSHLFLAQTYKELNDYRKVLSHISKTKFKLSNTENLFIKYDLLAEANEKLGDYKNAYIAASKRKVAMDSMTIYNDKKNFAEFNVKYKSIEKDKQIAEQQLKIIQEKNSKNLWIGISIIVLIILILFFQTYSAKQKQKKITVENELEKAKEIDVVRAELLGNISHEIRTPLTLIIGNLQMAQEEKTRNKKLSDYIDKALVSSKKVIEDSNQILELLKFEKNKQELKETTITITHFCKRIFLSFESLAAIKNIQLSFKSEVDTHVQIKSDENKLEKIINNLVSNAIKYSNSNSVINFELTQQNNLVKIKVKDQGLGIPPEEKEKVFDRFYQAKNSKNIGGIGIGLSLSKKFAELLNGDLTVNSELGKGSVFQLVIPYVLAKKMEEKKSVEVLEAKEQSTESLQKPKVLVVEDNIEMSNFLVEILQEKYHCTIAFNGEEALKKIKNTSFDLITSDIMMPKIDGFKFRETLSENEGYKNIPFVFISAKSLEEDKLKGFDLGIDDYIVKPFNKNELLARVKNLIENKKSREQWSIENKDLLEESIVSFDKKIIDKAEKAVLGNLSNENYKVVDLALEIGYSQRQLTRFLKQYTGMSPVKFILEIRLQKAYVLLQQKAFLTLSEVKYEIGITSTSYFNKKFKERFGVLPNEV